MPEVPALIVHPRDSKTKTIKSRVSPNLLSALSPPLLSPPLPSLLFCLYYPLNSHPHALNKSILYYTIL